MVVQASGSCGGSAIDFFAMFSATVDGSMVPMKKRATMRVVRYLRALGVWVGMCFMFFITKYAYPLKSI